MENNFITTVQYIIDYYELKQVCRRQDITYKRYFLYDQLKKANYSLASIGRIFNKNHASVLHGLRMHQVYTKSKDKVYFTHTEPIKKRLITIPEEINIKKAVLDCESWEEIVQIKLQITEGYF